MEVFRETYRTGSGLRLTVIVMIIETKDRKRLICGLKTETTHLGEGRAHGTRLWNLSESVEYVVQSRVL